MQVIVSGLLIFALFMGVFSSLLNKPSQGESWLKSFAPSKQRHIDKMMYETTIRRFLDQRAAMDQHIQDQKIFLSDLKTYRDMLLEIVGQMPDKENDVSLLPLKDLFKKFNRDSESLIDHERFIEAFAEQQKIIDHTDPKLFNEINDSMNEQGRLFSQQVILYEELKIRLEQIQDKIEKVLKYVTLPQYEELKDKVFLLLIETRFSLENIRERQAGHPVNREPVTPEIAKTNTNQEAIANRQDIIENRKRQINDFIYDQRVKIRNTDYKIQDQKKRLRDINDNIQDSMDRAKDKQKDLDRSLERRRDMERDRRNK